MPKRAKYQAARTNRTAEKPQQANYHEMGSLDYRKVRRMERHTVRTKARAYCINQGLGKILLNL
jgi:hypothetical protein